jgi:hypothetical protein
VDPDLLRRRYFRFAPDELLKRQVTGTVDVAGLPLMGVPDVEHLRPGRRAAGPRLRKIRETCHRVTVEPVAVGGLCAVER